MPKIIDNIEQKIYENALALFAAKGYNQVSMKDVAEASGIAVGTLYNYYSNKMDLFLNVFEEHINQVYTKLREIIERDRDPGECIALLYDEFVKIGGFSEELIKDNILNKNNEIINKLRDRIHKKTKSLVKRLVDGTVVLVTVIVESIHLTVEVFLVLVTSLILFVLFVG
ncbi:MAG: TetR/AcrR family transcriptional regulator, partial [Halanaerobiales bacterium]